MKYENAYFKNDDNRLHIVAGFQIPEGWWSRSYEYAFCLQFAEPSQVVADMGAGIHYRPFHVALSEICGKVYAVDHKPFEFNPRPNVDYIVADFSKSVPLEPNSLDRIFCVSVLEDLGKMIGPALKVFANLLTAGGLIVITMDSQYDMGKPLDKYPGVDMENFVDVVDAAGLQFREMPDWDKSNALYNQDFNLTPFHCVLVRKSDEG